MKRHATRTGWLVVAAAFIAGMTACSKVDNTIDEPSTTETPKTYTLTVTATKGDDDATRALSLNGKTLNVTWAEGDAVQVYHVSNPGTPLEMESTTHDGTLYALRGGATTTLSGTITGDHTPAAGDVLRLRFLPYPNYTTQEGTLDYIAAHCDQASATITVASVDAGTGDVTSLAPAEFQNQQAIVKFSLKRQDGTTPVEASNLTVKAGNETYNVTLATPASDIFVAIKNVSNKAVSLTANGPSGLFTYDKNSVSFEKGNYYAVGVKMTRQPSLGDIYFSDGTCSETLEAGKIPIGVIAYLGTDAFSENGTEIDGMPFTGHGLVLCLRNAASETDVNWSTEEVLKFDGGLVRSADDLKRTTNVSGYSNTVRLTVDSNKYPAAAAARNYTALPAPGGTTGWFLPSAQQWVKMLEGLGGLDESAIEWGAFFDVDFDAIYEWETALSKTGPDNYDSMIDSSLEYQSSSEYSIDANVCLYVSPHQGIGFMFVNKCGDDDVKRVRPVLAF